MVKSVLIASLIANSISLLITPFMIRFALRIGAVDKPNGRKVHRQMTPRLGGLAVSASFMLALFILLQLNPASFATTWFTSREGFVLTLAVLCMLFLGVWDDIRELRASQKFLVQFIISNMVYLAGARISSIANPFGTGTLEIGMLDYPLTILWIVGITNAFNLIDGLDGLATGVAIIAFLTIFPISLLNGDSSSAAISIVIAGALLGFLRYNFNPAKIFLGDSGSLVLGFILAVVSLKSATKGTATFAILTPILALGLPIIETLLSMIRRFLRSFLPGQSEEKSFFQRMKMMFQPDSAHIHHTLIRMGLSHRKAVLLLYLVSCALGIGAFAVTIVNNLVASLILLVVGAATIIGIRRLKYREMAVLENGVLLPLYDRPLLNRDSVQVFLDLAFMVISFASATYLTGGISNDALLMRSSLTNLAIVIAIQFFVFVAMGLYKGVSNVVGTNDILKLMKTVATATFFSYMAQRITAVDDGRVLFVMSILNLFFLLIFVLGFRNSFSVLRHLSHRHPQSGKRLLIYGADFNGLWMLDKILQLNYSSMMPVGFIDENPHLEGRILNGYPVLGGHTKLAEIATKMKIDEIIICCESMKGEILEKVKTFADEYNILLTRAMVVFEEIGKEPQKVKLSAPVLHLILDKTAQRPVPSEWPKTAIISTDIPITSMAQNAG
jgi:UDP-GlcNAc:undecaprenyl-phosphate/decaprenyl-phosphate GlcNAc-1-phosphate transferase